VKKKERKGSTGGACFILVDHVSAPVGFRANCIARCPHSAAVLYRGKKKLSDPAIVMENGENAKKKLRSMQILPILFSISSSASLSSLSSSHPFSGLPA